MAGRRVKVERFVALMAEPETWPALLVFIAEGGVLATWTRVHDVRYGDTLRWIEAKAERKAAYDQAIEDRGSFFRDRVTEGLSRAAFSDARKLYDGKGRLVPIHSIDDDTAAAVAGIEETQYGMKVRLVGKAETLTLLGRQHGMMKDGAAGTKDDPIHTVNLASASELRTKVRGNKAKGTQGDAPRS